MKNTKTEVEFTKIHAELLELKQYDIAIRIAKVFYDYGGERHTDGMNFIADLYNKK